MERILRSEKNAEIIFLPVRHHSPACALHVKNMIEKQNPQLVLIEGPENANFVLESLTHPDTKAPFAIYYSYHDKEGVISEEKEHFRCYYPFLDYSPELVALRTAAERDIQAEFIDLTYGEILYACETGKGLREKKEQTNYNDDYYLSQNQYLKKLCENAGLRSFDEFWEKYFELNASEDEKWFDDLMVYCRLARENQSEESIRAEGCLDRELHMAQNIAKKACEIQSFETILVVTGGFHTANLKDLTEKLLAGERIPQKKQKKLGEQEVFLLPYSMEATDALNGYASGMPHPGFYQAVWERTTSEGTGNTGKEIKGSEDAEEDIDAKEKYYRDTVLDYLVKVGKETRKKEENISTYDEICALQMVDGLSLLRGKEQPGVYELYDACLSCYVKGEYNIASNTPIQILRKQMTGNRVGSLCDLAGTPAILLDFKAQCKKYGIKIVASEQQEVTLQIFSSPKHRNMSKLFYRLEFLGVNFAIKYKGPNLRLRKDRNLIREIWKYKWSAGVDAGLVDVSVYGATIEEAVLSMIREKMTLYKSVGAAAGLLVQVFEMGTEQQVESVYEWVETLMVSDTDFYSIGDAVKSFIMLRDLAELYNAKLQPEKLILMGVRKLMGLLPSMTRIKEEDLDVCMDTLKELFRVTGREELLFTTEREELMDILEKMLSDHEMQPGLSGCICGILYGGNRMPPEKVYGVCKGYLTGTREQLLQTASFFHGLFASARDLVFSGEDFLALLDCFLKEVDQEEFMELLPELRLAFSFFTPREIHKLSKKVSVLHDLKDGEMEKRKIVSPGLYAYAKELDTYITSNCM